MIAAFLVLSAGAAETVPTCADLAASWSGKPPVRPDRQPALWWIEEPAMCPSGTRKAGSSPPKGSDLWCEDGRGRRNGPRTTFDANGHVKTESLWDRDHELGPRLEWDTDRSVVSRRSTFDDDGLLTEVVEWGADGSTTVIQHQRGQREGTTWRVDERGQLVLAEQWHEGMRNGRSCTWRDGQLDVDRVWVAGDPADAG